MPPINGGTPKSSISIGFFPLYYKPSILGYQYPRLSKPPLNDTSPTWAPVLAISICSPSFRRPTEAAVKVPRQKSCGLPVAKCLAKKQENRHNEDKHTYTKMGYIMVYIESYARYDVIPYQSRITVYMFNYTLCI